MRTLEIECFVVNRRPPQPNGFARSVCELSNNGRGTVASGKAKRALSATYLEASLMDNLPGQLPEIESYVERILMRVPLLPDVVRADICADVTERIASMVASNRNEGLDDCSAIALAISKYGDPLKVARKYATAWTGSPIRSANCNRWAALRPLLPVLPWMILSQYSGSAFRTNDSHAIAFSLLLCTVSGVLIGFYSGFGRPMSYQQSIERLYPTAEPNAIRRLMKLQRNGYPVELSGDAHADHWRANIVPQLHRCFAKLNDWLDALQRQNYYPATAIGPGLCLVFALLVCAGLLLPIGCQAKGTTFASVAFLFPAYQTTRLIRFIKLANNGARK